MEANHFEKKMLKHFIGYVEERDEYQQEAIYRILANACLYAFYLATILMLISLIIDTAHHTFSFGTMSLFIVQQFISYFTVNKLKKTGIAETEYDLETDYNNKIYVLKRKSIISGIQWSFSMMIMIEFLFPTIANRTITMNWFSMVVWIIAGAAFGLWVYFQQKKNIKLFKDS
ncbi:DUF3278 domain-containing protein [Paenibacillus massiliensis]|uniref:DUF3278 domain-containing protein n=1 Tax=Paenibacillus massiliensis TaxID=225917 RepID=UPI000685CBEB|nr:DUF3278 domain-containing protein [Paenibacillus massiliensis]